MTSFNLKVTKKEIMILIDTIFVIIDKNERIIHAS